MTPGDPMWRSMLFVPAHVSRFVERAHTRGADAYILDLEDSVPASEKAQARALLQHSVVILTKNGAVPLIRVNADPDVVSFDLEAACLPGVAAVVLPKVNGSASIKAVADRLDQLEAERGITAGSIRLIAQIENVAALPWLDEIASSTPRLLGMTLGSEDFAASAGMEPFPEALLAPNQSVVFACRRANILPFGFPASIADYSDIEKFRGHIRLARRLGLVGGFCIHPAQIAVMNEEYVPSSAELEFALGAIEAFEAAYARGRAAASFRGQMIDPPVVVRAREILRRAQGK
jgi:citrate lyase subunit beta / citryl-CoA lyase